MLRGNIIKVPTSHGENTIPLTPGRIDRWAREGWVDLRVKNMELWKRRLRKIRNSAARESEEETSSRNMYTAEYWKNFSEINPGKICGWIFSFEEKGERMKA